MKYHKTQQSGFSLVETLVAITILLLVIIGPMRISTSTARSTNFASEQVIAFFLAQEGIEMVQKERDDFVLQQLNGDIADSWADFTDQTNSGQFDDCFTNNGCNMRYDSTSAGEVTGITQCGTGNCVMYFDDSNVRSKITNDSSGTETVFTRKIFMEEVVPDEQIKVRSVVEWRTGSLRDSQEVQVETYLFNIYGT